MPSLGSWHWIVALILGALLIWAFVAIFGRVLNRAGYFRWWLLTMVVPLLNLVMIWIFALANWPGAKARAQT